MTLAGKHYLTPYLHHMGQTPEEQLQKNHAAIQILKKWIEEEISEEESIQREDYFDSFKEIVDSGRLPGDKIYSQE
jgi:predicted RNase H-like HicB family nuclease